MTEMGFEAITSLFVKEHSTILPNWQNWVNGFVYSLTKKDQLISGSSPITLTLQLHVLLLQLLFKN